MNSARLLLEKKSVSERIEIVAEDFASETNLFSSLDGFDLAGLLGISPKDGDWLQTGYTCLVSLDDNLDPIYHQLRFLEAVSSDDRIRELEEKSIRYEQGEADSDAVLTPEERTTIERGLNNERSADHPDIVVASTVLVSKRGIELEFQAEIGDGGDCFGCYGPYELRAGTAVDIQGFYKGECW